MTAWFASRSCPTVDDAMPILFTDRDRRKAVQMELGKIKLDQVGSVIIMMMFIYL